MSDIFDRRINRLREILSDREAALITNEKNIGYFCGFFHSEGYYLLTREKAYLLVDFRYIEAANQKAHGCEVICFHKLSEDLLKILAENEIKSVKIEAEYMTVARLRFFRHKLEAKGITVSDGSELDKKIAGCRIIKDETELEKIRTDLLAIINDNTMSEPEKIKRYALVRMESMNNRYSYHNVLKNRVLESGDKQLMECFSKVHDALVTWEKEQLTAIIVSGKNKGVFRPEIDASKYVNSLIMMLSSLEFPFFIFNLYDKYKNSFDYMIDEIIFKPLEAI